MSANIYVTKSFGKPVTSPVLIPVEHKSTPFCINSPFMVGGKSYGVTAISLGTPYGAVLVDNVDIVDVPKIGSVLGTHALFPKGASIVFIQVINEESIKIRLWQRDEGEKPFSPEAACVAGTVTMMLQKTHKNEINVEMGGNKVLVRWRRYQDDEVLASFNRELLAG